jgi:hypothetical protein
MSRMGVIGEIAITCASTRMNVECSACHLDTDFLSQGSGTPILYLTRCGHICCEMCRTNWFASGKETCPKCRQPQTRSNLIRIYYDIAQPAQPSISSTTVAVSERPGTVLQTSSEHFLRVVAGQTTDVFCACVSLPLYFSRTLHDLTLSRPQDTRFFAGDGHSNPTKTVLRKHA